MRYLLIVILIILNASLFGQANLIDKLITEAYSSKNSVKEYILWQQLLNQLDIESSNYRREEIYLGLAKFFYNSQLYPEALQYYKLTQTYLTSLDTLDLSECYLEIGNSYYQTETIIEAKTYWQKAVDLNTYPNNLAVLDQIINISQVNNDYDMSITYLLKQKELVEINGETNSKRATVLNNLAYAYHQQNNKELANEYFLKALDFENSLTTQQKLSIYQNIAIAKINEGQTEVGKDILLDLISQLTNTKQKVEVFQILGKIYAEENNYLEALSYYKQAETIDTDELNSDIIAETYFGLSAVYQNINEYDLAFEYLNKYKKIIDENKYLLEIKNTNLLNQRREIEQTEKQNQLFRASQKIQQTEIQKLQIDAKNQALETQSLKQDSAYRVSQLNVALKEKEIAKANSKNTELELIRLSNISRLAQQELSIVKSNQEKIELEKTNQERENALTKQKLIVQQRDAKIKTEQALNQLNQQELKQGRKNQRNTLYFSGLLGLLALLTITAYLIKKRANEKLETAFNKLSVSESKLKSAETKITTLLKQQVSGPIADALIGENVTEDITQKFVAVLFLDIRDYTKFCETKTPSEIIAYQNQVFGFMINIIEKHNGVVNQLLGDGFMATFGAPVSMGNDSLNAYLAANEIREVLHYKNFNKEIHPTKIGIGIHAGNVVAGNVGNEERKQYSISGNTVILAARLEQLNKENNSSLIYSQELYDQLPDEYKSMTNFKEVMVKGRKEPIKIAVVK